MIFESHPRITHFEKTDSTQIQARNFIERIKKGKENFKRGKWYIFTANEQTLGLAKYDRSWVSPPKINIYATFVCSWPKDKSYLKFNMPQVGALSVLQTLECFGFTPKLKWINDVLINHKKVSGVLCEAYMLEDYDIILVGVGINVNMDKVICDGIDQPATSMLNESGSLFDCEKVFKKLSKKLMKNFELLKRQGFESFLYKIDEKLAYKDRKINVKQEGQVLQGCFQGIDNIGRMKLRVEGEDQDRIIMNGRVIVAEL